MKMSDHLPSYPVRRPSHQACSLLLSAASLVCLPHVARAEEPLPAGPVASLPAETAPSADRDRSAIAVDGHPMAGFHNGVFYLRDENDNFRLYVSGRAQVDAYSFFGPGVPDTPLKATLFLRRVRPELGGEFLGHWQWQLAGDWGATSSVDNAAGTNQPAPSAFVDAQTVAVRAVPTDVWLNFRADKSFNVQIGQYDAPFMMENRTSDKYIAFMERSLAVRAFGIPTNKEIGAMVWGETAKRELFYSVGVFNGDGQNRPNLDNQADLMARVFTHPLEAVLKGAQIGASFRYGGRNPQGINYNYPGMSTQGGWGFWGSTYGATHVIPAGRQIAVAGELRVPVQDFDVTAEAVYVDNHTREGVNGAVAQVSPRKGSLHGVAYYVQLGFWPLGNRDINGEPGYENPAHVDFKKADRAVPAHSLQLLAKWEQLSATYAGASRAGTLDPAANLDGDIRVNAFSLGANYWASKHVRLTLNYVANLFPESTPAGNANQRARSPSNRLPQGVNDDARESGHVLHELLARFAVAF
jgi:phosphate-selective porin